jgi:hypothetical protein
MHALCRVIDKHHSTVGKKMIEEVVAIWNGEKLVAGTGFQVLMDKIEKSKEITGGFYTHVANKIFSQVLADLKLSHHWTVKSSTTKSKLWKYLISLNGLLKTGPVSEYLY